MSRDISAIAPVHLTTEELRASKRAAQRFDAAKAALTGLLAATPATTQSTASADAYAKRAVRYADALLDALNHGHEEASHASRR